MGLFSKDKKKLDWKNIQSKQEIEDILRSDSPTLIFKHSTRCAISSMALSQFEREWKADQNLCELAYLDLIQYREVSNFCTEMTGVRHQSPQVILLKNGKAIHDASHQAINANEIEKILLNDEN